jgi:glycosyltransferase involved in cell wall biosynthesis
MKTWQNSSMLNKPTPRISIITPVYNGAKFIEKTIVSVLVYAKNTEYEYILVNDGSTDESLEIISKYKEQVTIISQQNAGEASAVNSGINASRGELGLVVSADDPLISAQLFEEAFMRFEANPKLKVIYPDWQMISNEDLPIRIVKSPDYSFEVLLGQSKCIPGPGAIFDMVAAKKIGGRSPHYRYVSDFDFWLRLSQFGEFERIPRVLAQWRQHPESTSVSSRGVTMAKERIDVIEEFLRMHPQRSKLARQAMAYANYNAAILAFFESEVRGRQLMLKGLILKRGWINGSKFRIVLYLLLLPLSRFIFSMFRKLGFLKNVGRD